MQRCARSARQYGSVVLLLVAAVAHPAGAQGNGDARPRAGCVDRESGPSVSTIVSDTRGERTRGRLECIASLLQWRETRTMPDSVVLQHVCGAVDPSSSLPASLRRERLPECHFTVRVLTQLLGQRDSTPPKPPPIDCSAIARCGGSDITALVTALDSLRTSITEHGREIATLSMLLAKGAVPPPGSSPVIVTVTPSVVEGARADTASASRCRWTCHWKWGGTIAGSAFVGALIANAIQPRR